MRTLRRARGSAIFPVLVTLLGPALTGSAHTARRSWASDNGNGTYSNPLFYDEFSDPDMIRVGADFSEVQQPGLYRIAAGGESTRPFRIATDVWRDTILKALNFFYVERCGMAIPGVHGVCHRDWQAVHGDKRIIINGGWHDAGDLTQGMGNTGDIVYAMFSLAEGLRAQGADPQLYDRLIEEARWGLDWVLKTSFGDGYRNAGSVNSRRTDGILGTFDDVTATAKNDPFVNFLASAAEAIAARVLKDSDPRLAAYSLRMAEADWEFAVEGMAKAGPPSPERFHVAFDSNGVVHEIASEGVLASVQL